MLRVWVLGELRAERDGTALTLPQRRPARVLLGWLALHPGLHARSTVAARLWPNVLDQSARTSLRSALSALRAAVGGEMVVATRERVGLADEVLVDARECERLLSADRHTEALELCRGELLSGFDEDWVLDARDEHRRRVADALAQLATAAADRGDHKAAVRFGRRRAVLDPLDEQAHRELMRLLADAGDRAGALALYERFAGRLRGELGVAPSSATRATAAELRAGPTASRLPVPLPARITAVAARGPLVGRDHEVAKLCGIWTRATRQRRHLAVITGEPGIGKTRLVAGFAAQLNHLGTIVLYGRAEEEALVPYQPFVEALADLLRQGVEPPDGGGALAPLIPETADAGGASAVTESSSGARLRLFEAVGTVLDIAAAGRPVLLVLDDLHWAEPPTIRLLHHLAARPVGPPQMIAVTYRDTADGPFAAAVGDLYRELPVERVALGGLDRDAVATLLGGDRPPEVVEAIHGQTAGNPFFIEHLLPGDSAGVTEMVRQRVGALGAEARAVLDAAAVSGAEFELSVVAEVVGLPVDQTLGVLDTAVKGRLIAEIPNEPGRYAFVHALVRDTLAGALTAARRARLHELFAAALEPRAAREPNRYLVALANHALEAAAGAGDPIRAAELAEEAAARAGAVLAYEDAATLLRRGVSVLERRGSSLERRAELQCLLGEALLRAGLGDQGEPALGQATDLARRAGRPDLIARAALGLGGAGVTILGAEARVVLALERALDAVADGHPALRVRLLARLAIELAYEPDSARRHAISAEALALAHSIDDPAALAAALNARHVTAWGPDGTEERLAVATEMLALAERAGDCELALQARNWRFVDQLEQGDGHAVRQELDAYAELSAETRLPAYAWYVPLWRATLALLAGRIGEGLDLSRRARDLARQAGDANADVFFSEQYLLRMLVQGRIQDVDPAGGGLQGEVDQRARSGPAWRAYRFTFAWWHAARGELDEARADFEAAVADGLSSLERDVNWLAALSSAAQASVLLGDSDRAAELAALLQPYRTRMVVTARGAAHGGSVAYLLARLATLCGDEDAADELFADAARRDERAGAAAFVVRDLQHHAAFLDGAGRFQRAGELLQAATERAQSLGLEGALDPRMGR